MFSVLFVICVFLFFFCNHTATTEIYTLSLHDALPIFEHEVFEVVREAGLVLFLVGAAHAVRHHRGHGWGVLHRQQIDEEKDRKSTRLNSSHPSISYAVFCLKKKKTNTKQRFKNTTISN